MYSQLPKNDYKTEKKNIEKVNWWIKGTNKVNENVSLLIRSICTVLIRNFFFKKKQVGEAGRADKRSGFQCL